MADSYNFIRAFCDFQVTVGASFLSQTIALQDSTTVKFEIWDTAGQERYTFYFLAKSLLGFKLEFKLKIFFASIQIRCIGSSLLPRGCGFCCRIRYHKPRLILKSTVLGQGTFIFLFHVISFLRRMKSFISVIVPDLYSLVEKL